MSIQHLTLNLSKTEPIASFQTGTFHSPPQSVTTLSFPLLRPKTLKSALTLLILFCPTFNQAISKICQFYLNMYPQSQYFSSPPLLPPCPSYHHLSLGLLEKQLYFFLPLLWPLPTVVLFPTSCQAFSCHSNWSDPFKT